MILDFLSLRSLHYQRLSGAGIEIGAFEHPAVLPSCCNVLYCDVINKKEAISLFPEINHDMLPDVDLIIDIDKDGLISFEDNSLDFVIINHVLEHLFDPIFAICECFRVLKKGGKLLASVPDKRFTFDQPRTLTSNVEIFKRVKRYPKGPVPLDYLDLLKNIHPELLNQPSESQQKALKGFLNRREHLNIWTDASFKSFFDQVCKRQFLGFILKDCVLAKDNQFEFFGCWEKHSFLYYLINLVKNKIIKY